MKDYLEILRDRAESYRENQRAAEIAVPTEPVMPLRQFIRESWEHFDHAEYVHGWHIDCLADHLSAASSGSLPRLLVNVPRGSSKTSIVGIQWLAWHWTFRPSEKFIYGSHSLGLSYHTNRLFQTLVTSPWYCERFPWVELTIQNASETVNALRGERVSVSKGGGSLGRHSKFQVVDDPSNPNLINEGSTSELIKDLEDAWSWYQDTLSGAMLDSNVGDDVRVVIMQRLHAKDLTGRILEAYGNRYLHLVIPQFYDAKRAFVSTIDNLDTGKPWRDPRSLSTEVMNPERRDYDRCMARKLERTERAWWSQEQQEPLAQTEDGVKERDIQIYTKQPDLEYAKIVIAVDATFGADVNSDYVAIEAVAQIKDLYYLLDLVRKKMTFTETLEEIKLFCMRWRMASKLIIEKAANGQGLADMIAKDKDFVLKAELVSCEGLSKQARLRSVSHLFERHLVYFPSTDLAPWAPTVINEVIYLGSAAHDDTADAFVHALRYLHLGNLQPPKFILPKEDTLRTRFKAPPMWEQRPRF